MIGLQQLFFQRTHPTSESKNELKMSMIRKEIINHCLVLTMNRADKRNALSADMYRAMADALAAHRDDDDVKVLLIKGEGEHFTAGNDLGQFAQVNDKTQLKDTLDFMQQLAAFPQPVVAQVRGMAVGIGTTLLLHCDFVYCDSSSFFSLPFINLALVPEYASSLILPAAVGHRKAAEWLMLGEGFGAEEALQHGLVNKVVASDKLEAQCQQTVTALCQKPRVAMRQTKALMKHNASQVSGQIEKEIDVFVEQLKSDAAKEAFSAFLEKRKPDPAKYN